jgi:hypothetical protein
MHLITNQHFDDTAHVANEHDSLMLMIFHFTSAIITILCILHWHHPRQVKVMDAEMRLNVKFSYFGTLKHHYHNLTQRPNKPGIRK